MRAAVPSKATVQNAVDAVKEHIVRTLCSRAGILNCWFFFLFELFLLYFSFAYIHFKFHVVSSSFAYFLLNVGGVIRFIKCGNDTPLNSVDYIRCNSYRVTLACCQWAVDSSDLSVTIGSVLLVCSRWIPLSVFKHYYTKHKHEENCKYSERNFHLPNSVIIKTSFWLLWIHGI